jgi:hypothetical protein
MSKALLDQVRAKFEMTPEYRKKWGINQGTVIQRSLQKSNYVEITLATYQTVSIPELQWLEQLLRPKKLTVGAHNDYDFGYVSIVLIDCESLEEC